MPQKTYETLKVSTTVKIELERRKKVLSKKEGRSVSFDEVLRDAFGWRRRKCQ